MRFEITFDYLCPFARNANEAVASGLNNGANWEVTFRPFSLSQVHIEKGQADVFEDPIAPGVLALQWGLAVRDTKPEQFNDAHVALFSARHDHGQDISDPAVIREAVASAGLDTKQISEVVASGAPAKTLAHEHTEAVERWHVFGVPTIIHDDVATFVRLMNRGDHEDFERTLSLLDWAELNEFKRTRVPR